jgi:hypothetical protein
MLRLLQANQEDLDALQAVYEACPDYFERRTGGTGRGAEFVRQSSAGALL